MNMADDNGYESDSISTIYDAEFECRGCAFVVFCTGRSAAGAMDSPAMSRRESAAATRFDLSAGAMVRLEGGGSVRSGRRGHDEAGGMGPVRSGHQGHGELDPAAGAMARLEGRARNDNSVTSSSPSSGMMGSSNRENVESIVYASMNEDDNNNCSNGAAGPAQEGLVSHAILSGDDEARSMCGIGGGI